MTLVSRLPQIANNLRRDVPRELRSTTERTVIPAARARIRDVSGELALSIVAVDHGHGVLIEARAVDAQGRAYGQFVELGTHHASPHPFLIPALEQARPVIIEATRAAIGKACQ